MQFAQNRVLILAALLAIGVWLLSLIQSSSHAEPEPRWPSDETIYLVAGWTPGPLQVEAKNGNQYVTRVYHPTDGGPGAAPATVALTTSPAAKRIYRAGPDVPFLGSGFSIEPLPADVTEFTHGYAGFIARRGDEAWLQLHAYGERRGWLGNGLLAWSLTFTDAMLGRPNDYYLARVLVPVTAEVHPAVVEAATLADELFQRFARWYAFA